MKLIKINIKIIPLLGIVLFAVVCTFSFNLAFAQTNCPTPNPGFTLNAAQKAVCASQGKTCEADCQQLFYNAQPIPSNISNTLNSTTPSSPTTQGGANNSVCGDDSHYEYKNGVCMPKPIVTGGIADSNTLMDVILIVLKYLLYFAGLIAVIFVVIGGYWYITAAGNEEQSEKGRKTLINAIIGVVAVILAFAIITIITNMITNKDGIGIFGGTSNNKTGTEVQYNPDDRRSIAP